MEKQADDSWRAPGYRPGKPYGALRDVVQAGTRFEVEGEGPAIVLLHGVGLDLTIWSQVVPLLAQKYTVIRYDIWGHGQSQKPISQLRLRDYAGQLESLVDYLKLGRFALVGFSMGTMIAQSYAVTHGDRLAALCLLNSVHNRGPEERAAVSARLEQAEHSGLTSLVEPALARWLSNDYREEHPETVAAIRHRLETNDRNGFLSAYRVFATADQELAGRLGEISCPTLVMTGARDSGSTPAMSRALAAEIPGAELEILEGLAHLALVEDAGKVAESILTFLSKISG